MINAFSLRRVGYETPLQAILYKGLKFYYGSDSWAKARLSLLRGLAEKPDGYQCNDKCHNSGLHQ